MAEASTINDQSKVMTTPLHHGGTTGASQHETVERHGPGRLVFTESHESDPTKPVRLRHLVKRPRLRQYIHNDVIVREQALHEASKLELWLDLVFASIVHLLAEGVIEEASWLNLARFILTFYATYSVWADMRSFINMSGTDDWLQRLYILLSVLLLLGFSNNASGIRLETGEHSAEGTTEGPAAEAIHIAAAMFTEDSSGAIMATFAMLSVALAIRVLRFAVYALCLPRFRSVYVSYTCTSLIVWALWLPPIWVHTVPAVFGFPTAAVLFEILSQYSLVIGKYISKRRSKSDATKSIYIPAIALEHHVERLTAFIVIVLGEVVISSGFIASGTESGIHSEFGRSCLGVIISFEIAVLYFNESNCRRFVHALRRHWFTGKTHSLLHFPLAASIVLMAGCLTVMLPNDEIAQGLHWYFSGSLAVTIATLFLLGVLHRSLDDHSADLVHRNIRLAMRLVVVLIFALVPLREGMTSTQTLGLHAGVLASLIVVDIFGTLGSRARREAGEGEDLAQEGGGDHQREQERDSKSDKDAGEEGMMPIV